MLQTLVPANRAPGGSMLYLANYADQPEWLNQVLGLAAANIAKELAVVAPMASSFEIDFNQPKGGIRP
jgi:hypothetical protein